MTGPGSCGEKVGGTRVHTYPLGIGVTLSGVWALRWGHFVLSGGPACIKWGAGLVCGFTGSLIGQGGFCWAVLLGLKTGISAESQSPWS